MRLYVVRHVKAGDRKRWGDAPDIERPISAGGLRQAEALARRLVDAGVTRLISSPYVRCRQSLEPLGERLGLDVETDERLAEGQPFEQVLALVAEVPSRTVLCSHGDIVPELITALVRRGMTLTTEPDWRKATLWTLRGPGLDDDGELRFTTAKVEPPPPSSAGKSKSAKRKHK